MDLFYVVYGTCGFDKKGDSMNQLHLHMYNVGLLTVAQLLVMYPAETSVSIGTKATTQKAIHG